MEPYWKLEYDINLGDQNKHLVELFQYSERSVVLISTSSFGKAFSKFFKKLSGTFNSNLKINGEKTAGWVFYAKTETLQQLNKILEQIYNGDILPEKGIIVPEFNSNSKSKSLKIYNLLEQVSKLTPEENLEVVLSEDDKCKTTIYFNSDEETITEGNLVRECKFGNKTLEIYQLMKE